MVEDLRRNVDLMAANPIIAAIAGHADSRRRLVDGEPQLNPVLLFVLEADFTVRISPDHGLETCTTEDEAGHWALPVESGVGGEDYICFSEIARPRS